MSLTKYCQTWTISKFLKQTLIIAGEASDHNLTMPGYWESGGQVCM